jgi:hypothetical protein
MLTSNTAPLPRMDCCPALFEAKDILKVAECKYHSGLEICISDTAGHSECKTGF